MHYAAMMLFTAILSIAVGPNSEAFDASYKSIIAGDYRQAIGEFGGAMRQIIREADVHSQNRYQ